MTTCPKCNAPIGGSEDQCARCGIFFDKWRERENNVAAGNMARYSSVANLTSSEFNWAILILIAAVIGSIFCFLYYNQ